MIYVININRLMTKIKLNKYEKNNVGFVSE